jgi:membrane associated rhomboid family serine protease
MFGLCVVFGSLIDHWYSSEEAKLVGNMSAFYLLLTMTTVIFGASQVIALLLITWLLDVYFKAVRSGAGSVAGASPEPSGGHG